MRRKNKNAFTLIELLAVIVILAVIALIATPIILGIVEDAKKDAFLRSVELVISTTDIDIASKTFEEEYTYTITDGNISNLELGIKNTDGMNGSIIYDMEGKEVYAIHNGVYCVKKTADMSKAEISDYVEGECLAKEDKSPLGVLTKLVPNENDVVTYTNGQLINLGEYGIRYQGNDPDNYIYFNCEDYSNQTSETCETWRIIGVVDGKVKIISEEIGKMAWDANVDGVYDNNWNDSSLKTYLNGENEGDYYASLTETTKNSNYISPSTWYLKGHNDSRITKDVMYNLERTNGTVLYETPYIENTKIGIMYASDWVYAAMETDSCLSTTTLNSLSCKPSNWINQGSTNNQWLIVPDSGGSDAVFGARADGYVGYGCAVNRSLGVRPVLYLSSDIELEGEGTQNIPFKLKAK